MTVLILSHKEEPTLKKVKFDMEFYYPIVIEKCHTSLPEGLLYNSTRKDIRGYLHHTLSGDKIYIASCIFQENKNVQKIPEPYTFLSYNITDEFMDIVKQIQMCDNREDKDQIAEFYYSLLKI